MLECHLDWCPPLDEPIQALAGNFFETVITPMPLE